MGRAEVLLAACAIAVALLAGATGAVASADPGDSAASESTSGSSSDAGTEKSAERSVDQPTDDSVPDTYASGQNDRTAGDQSGDVGGSNAGGAQESGDDHDGDKKPVDDDSGKGNNLDGRTVNRVPLLIPEAPPSADLVPFPEELPRFPEEPVPPPADLPPGVPGELDPVDVTMVGPSASLSDGNGSPVMTMPAVVAPVIAPPGHLLGASIAARGTLGSAVTSPSRRAGEPAPPARQPATSEPRLREPPTSSSGLSGGQHTSRTGYVSEGLPRVRLSDMAAGALPGVAGIMVMTSAGVCLGYRQAMAGQQLRAQGVDRFLA
jgi:hypothetical protein